MTEFKPGDRVSVEGAVEAVDGWMVFVTLSDGRCGWTKESGLTLLGRPVPPLPTAFGSRIIATVRGFPDVPLVRANYSFGGLHCWVSETRVAHCTWHSDSDITSWRPWVDDDGAEAHQDDTDPHTQPEPPGLVERVSEAISLHPLGAPRAAVLAVADWLDEQEANPTATWLIRREVGDSP